MECLPEDLRDLLKIAGALAPELVESDVACDSYCVFRGVINPIRVFCGHVAAEIEAGYAFGREFGVIFLLEESENGAAEDA